MNQHDVVDFTARH